MNFPVRTLRFAFHVVHVLVATTCAWSTRLSSSRLVTWHLSMMNFHCVCCILSMSHRYVQIALCHFDWSDRIVAFEYEFLLSHCMHWLSWYGEVFCPPRGWPFLHRPWTVCCHNLSWDVSPWWFVFKPLLVNATIAMTWHDLTRILVLDWWWRKS